MVFFLVSHQETTYSFNHSVFSKQKTLKYFKTKYPAQYAQTPIINGLVKHNRDVEHPRIFGKAVLS